MSAACIILAHRKYGCRNVSSFILDKIFFSKINQTLLFNVSWKWCMTFTYLSHSNIIIIQARKILTSEIQNGSQALEPTGLWSADLYFQKAWTPVEKAGKLSSVYVADQWKSSICAAGKFSGAITLQLQFFSSDNLKRDFGRMFLPQKVSFSW